MMVTGVTGKSASVVHELIADGRAEGERLDSFLGRSGVVPSRSQAQRLIEEGNVTINGRSAAKSGQKLAPGDLVRVAVPPPGPNLAAEPEAIPLDVVYEDEDIIVINKPPGMVVHPAAGTRAGTLVNALLAHANGLSAIGGVERPGIVHRLDKDTSGLLVVAKNDLAHQSLSRQIAGHAAGRRYLALVAGRVGPDSGAIDAAIGRHPVDRMKMAVVDSGGRDAVTHYRVLERFTVGDEQLTLLEARLETGRTHQIRVHMAACGYPLVGDQTYGPRKKRPHPAVSFPRQALHAWRLSLRHPRTGLAMEFEAPLPSDFAEFLTRLRARQQGGSNA